MAKIHELVLKIDGKLNKSVDSSFSSVVKKASTLKDKLKEFSKIEIKGNKFNKMQDSLAKTEEKLKSARQNTLELKRAFNESKQKTEELARKFKETGGTSKELAKQLQASREETSRLSQKYEKSKASVSSFSNKVKEQKEQLNSLKKSLDDAGFGTEKFAKKQEMLKTKMSMNENYEGMQKSFRKAKDHAKTAAKRAAIFGGAAAVPLKFAIDEESTTAEIAKVADFANDKQKKEVTDSLKKMITTEIPMSYQEIGELAAAGAQGGIETVDLSKFSELAAKMGVAFDIEAGDAGQKMANWKAAFGMDMGELQELGDKINYLGNNSAASAPAISNILSKVGALGEVAGVGSGEVAGLGAAMVAMGTDDDVAATGIKKVLTTLAAGGNKATKNYLGMGGEELSKAMKADGADTIVSVFEKIKALEPEKQTAALKDIFGQQNIGAIAPLLNNLDLVKDYLGMVGDKSQYAGSMQKEFEAQAGTTANQLKLLRNQAADAGMVIGSAMLPTLKEGVKKLQEIALKVSDFAKKNPEAVKSILKVGAAIAGLSVGVPIIKSVYDAFRGLQFGFRLFKDGLKFVGLIGEGGKLVGIISKIGLAIKAVIGFLVANPVVAIVLGIVAAVILLWKNWDKVKAIAGAAIEWMNTKIEAGKVKVGELKQIVSDKFTAMQQFIKNAGNAIKNFFLDPINRARDAVGQLKEKLSGIASTIKSKVSEKLGKLTSGGSVTGFATGGVVRKPQMALVGEGGDHEAIIPLNRDKRSQALWEYAGNKMGLLEQRRNSPNYGINTVAGTTNSPINITIAVDARGSGNEENVRNAINAAIPNLKRTIADVMNEVGRDRQRRAFT